MHPLYAAPPHLLTLIRELLPIGFPLESLVKFIEQDWKSGFTTHDIADWAAIEGITHLESTERRIHPAETNYDSENAGISNQIKAIQTEEAQMPLERGIYPALAADQPPNASQFEEISKIRVSPTPSISNHFKANQTEEAPLPPERSIHHPSSPSEPEAVRKFEGISEVRVSNEIKPPQSSEPSPSNPKSAIRSPQSQRRRTGKVAQLPSAIREQVNQMLDDGHPYREIIDWLTTNGHPGFNQENISNWAQGGFQDWLNHQEALDQHKILAEYAKQIVAECPGTTFKEACDAIIQMDLYSALNGFEMNGLHQLLKDKPEFWFKLINTMTGFNRAKLAEDKFKWQKSQAEKRGAVREGRGIHPASPCQNQEPANAAQASSPQEPPVQSISNQIKPDQSQEDPHSPVLPPALPAFPLVARPLEIHQPALSFYFHPYALPSLSPGSADIPAGENLRAHPETHSGHESPPQVAQVGALALAPASPPC